MESKNFDFSTLVKILNKNLKIFIIVAVVAAVLGAIFSAPMFMKPLYKSVAVVYPVNINLYSDESETEQLLQIFQSNDIRDEIIDKYNLYSRYGIAKDKPSARFYVNKEYNDRVVTSKTQYESVVLEVLDHDPDTAKLIADDVLLLLNEKIQEFYNMRGERQSQAYKTQMDYQLQVIDSIEDRLSQLSKDKKLMQYESQSRELVRGYVESLAGRGNSSNTQELQKWLEDVLESGSLFQALQLMSNNATYQYGEMSRHFLDWRRLAYQDINYLDVVVSPEVPDKKSWPVRWLVVVMAVASALLLTLVILVFKGSKA